MRQNEKRLLLVAIERLRAEMAGEGTFDQMERMQNLLDCLVAMSWEEVDRRN